MGDHTSQELTEYGDDRRGYLALPAGGEGPGVLVLHAPFL